MNQQRLLLAFLSYDLLLVAALCLAAILRALGLGELNYASCVWEGIL